MGIESSFSCECSQDTLLKFLLVKVAPVMMKVRPSVLIRICNCGKIGHLQRYDSFCLHQQEILNTLKVDFRIMKNTGKDIQVLFYDREEMSKTLLQPHICKYLASRGYALHYDADGYLDELQKRFQRAEFPHEIGIFLGYPFKDVLGFIENRQDAIPLVNVPWQVFGDPAESLQRMWMYRFAEDIGRTAILHYKDIKECIEQIRKTVYT